VGGVPDPEAKALPGDLGYFLHAERLSFRHPESGRPIDIECIPPTILRSGYSESYLDCSTA
jgi:23S rRNA pseudouridine1911/1915/1917 synthase